MKTDTAIHAALVVGIVLATGAAAWTGLSLVNPDKPGAAQPAQVPEFCAGVLGLNPSEPLEGAYRTGRDRPDFWSDPYWTCIVSLSNSLTR